MILKTQIQAKFKLVMSHNNSQTKLRLNQTCLLKIKQISRLKHKSVAPMMMENLNIIALKPTLVTFQTN